MLELEFMIGDLLTDYSRLFLLRPPKFLRGFNFDMGLLTPFNHMLEIRKPSSQEIMEDIKSPYYHMVPESIASYIDNRRPEIKVTDVTENFKKRREDQDALLHWMSGIIEDDVEKAVTDYTVSCIENLTNFGN